MSEKKIKNLDEFLEEHNQKAEAGKESDVGLDQNYRTVDRNFEYTILNRRLSEMYNNYIRYNSYDRQRYAASFIIQFQSAIENFVYKIPINPNDRIYSEIKKIYDSIYENATTESNIQSVLATPNSQHSNSFSRLFHYSDESQEKSIPRSVCFLQTFLTNKDDNYYMRNIRPLFPINDEPRDGAISKSDLQDLFGYKTIIIYITRMTDNPQLISRIYANALAVGLNSNRESLVVQENFGNLESTVQQFVEAGILDKNRLPKIAQDRLESMDKQRSGRY